MPRQPETQRFLLTRPQLQMPRRGRVLSANLGHRKDWSAAVAAHVDRLCEVRTLRYIGTLVADLHRTLLYGGIFLYPGSAKQPHGKLRLLFQAAPMAFLIEQAGGGATTGGERLLALTPASITQRVSASFGSLQDVQQYVDACGLSRPVPRSLSALCESDGREGLPASTSADAATALHRSRGEDLSSSTELNGHPLFEEDLQDLQDLWTW